MSSRLEKTFRGAVAVGLVSLAAMTAAHATIFSAGPNPFPTGSGVDLNAPSGICILGTTECTQDILISTLQPVSLTQAATGFDQKLTATFLAAFNNGATATLSLVPGTFFEVVTDTGYNPLTNPVGTFSETLVSASFAGSDSLGNSITAFLTNAPSVGTVTIAPANGGFNVTNTFTVNAGSTVNGIPIAVSTLAATNTLATTPPVPVTSVPEPSSLIILAMALGSIMVIRGGLITYHNSKHSGEGAAK